MTKFSRDIFNHLLSLSTKCWILYHFVLCTWCCFTNHFRRLLFTLLV